MICFFQNGLMKHCGIFSLPLKNCSSRKSLKFLFFQLLQIPTCFSNKCNDAQSKIIHICVQPLFIICWSIQVVLRMLKYRHYNRVSTYRNGSCYSYFATGLIFFKKPIFLYNCSFKVLLDF